MFNVKKRRALTALFLLCAVMAFGMPETPDQTNIIQQTDQTDRVAPDPVKKQIPPFSIDITMGVFFPEFDLGTGMNPSFDLCLNSFVPVSWFIPANFLESFDVGISFYMIPGTAVGGRDARIIFLGALADLYYRLPFSISNVNIYVLLGMGISSASAWVANGTVTGVASSADFTLRPGIGCRWEFLPHWYARLDIAWFMAFEKISAIGLPVTLGVGYAF